MDFRLLGPVEAWDGDRLLPLGRGRQVALLACLLLEAGRTCPVPRLVEDLWGERAPDTAPKMVQIAVSALRRVLPEGTVRTRAGGYVADIPREAVDAHRFERLVREARRASGDPAAARALLDQALALWRGPALAGLADEPFAVAEAARLEELRLAAIEERIDADLALGRHAELAGELPALVARHPLRERLRAQHVLALYRSGRQADALAAYAAARDTLDAQLGLAPSAALRDLERAILRQDPSLDAPGTPAPDTPRRGPVRYARSGEISVAYQVSGGAGPPDIVLAPGFLSHLEKDWEEPRHARFLDGLGALGRLIRFDKRGTGLSDRPPGLPHLEVRIDDVRAVMDAAGSRQAVVVGYSEGGAMAILFAATRPERVRALVLIGSYAKRMGPDDDYPWAAPREERMEHIAQLERNWGFEQQIRRLCPSADEAMERWWGERCRAAASPGAVRALAEMNSSIDVRAVLPAIHVPTLVIHRTGDSAVPVGHGRYLAERIPGARLVELPGADHFVAADPEAVLAPVARFLEELAASPGDEGEDDDRTLAAVLLADAAGPQAREEVLRHRGRPVRADAVELAATFDGPARAVRAALAVRERSPSARVAVHVGEVWRAAPELRGEVLGASRAVLAAAEPGAVLVTTTVRDLVVGTGLPIEEGGGRPVDGAPAVLRAGTAA